MYHSRRNGCKCSVERRLLSSQPHLLCKERIPAYLKIPGPHYAPLTSKSLKLYRFPNRNLMYQFLQQNIEGSVWLEAMPTLGTSKSTSQHGIYWGEGRWHSSHLLVSTLDLTDPHPRCQSPPKMPHDIFRFGNPEPKPLFATVTVYNLCPFTCLFKKTPLVTWCPINLHINCF